MAIPARAQAALTRATIQWGTWHDVMYLNVLAFCEAVLPNRLTSKTKARITSGRDDALLGSFEDCSVAVSIRDAMLGYFRGCMGRPRFQ